MTGLKDASVVLGSLLSGRGARAAGAAHWMAAAAVIVTVGFLVLASAPDRQAVAPAATGGGRVTAVWQPAEDTDWMWELGKPLKTSKPGLMGTGITAWNGDTAPGDNPVVFDIDGITIPPRPSQPCTRRRHGSATSRSGTAGNYYSAATRASPPPTTPSSPAGRRLGNKLSGYPEYFLDINSPSTVASSKR